MVHQYTMNGTPLDSVSHHPYLGVELSSNLNWSFHIETIIGKANRSLGFIRRTFIPVQKMLKVRPSLPSFFLFWNSPAACGTHILKSVATILKEYSGEPPDL